MGSAAVWTNADATATLNFRAYGQPTLHPRAAKRGAKCSIGSLPDEALAKSGPACGPNKSANLPGACAFFLLPLIDAPLWFLVNLFEATGKMPIILSTQLCSTRRPEPSLAIRQKCNIRTVGKE